MANDRVQKIPAGRGQVAVNMGKKMKLDKGTLKKLLKRVVLTHKMAWSLVAILIIVSAICDVQSSVFIGRVIDRFINPVIQKYSQEDVYREPNQAIDFGNYNYANTNNVGERETIAYETDGKVEVSIVDMQALKSSLWAYISQIIIIFAVGIIAQYAYNRIMIYIAQGVQKEIRNEMFSKMQNLPIKYFDINKYGDIMSRYTNDIETLNQMISQSIPSVISTVVTVAVVFASMIAINGWLTIFSVCLIFGLMFTTKNIARIASKYSIKQQEDLGKINGYVEELINGQKVVKVFTHEEKAIEGFDNLNFELYDSSVKANTVANILMPIMGKMSRLQYVIIAIVGGVVAIKYNAMTIGNFVAYLQLTDRLGMPINQVTQQFASVVMALAGAKRIFDLIDEKQEADEGFVELVNLDENNNIVEYHTKNWAWKVPCNYVEKEEYKKYLERYELPSQVVKEDGDYLYLAVKGHIDIQDVTFGYVPGKTVLHDITLYAKPGQKIAFVGATGAGKTTISNLINRFYDIQEGSIIYDGINIFDIKKWALRKSLGVVLQDTNLFTGTIKENIRYGRPEATDAEVLEAAKLANAHGFIKRLPNGYDTVLTENGSELSQGQRQLLSIARAAIADPPVMILDEATSSIDTRTEKIVQDGMDKLMNNRTVLVIAHRLSTVRNSKAIMVLDHGKIIERGEHDFLLSLKGTYYNLYTGAFELE